MTKATDYMHRLLTCWLERNVHQIRAEANWRLARHLAQLWGWARCPLLKMRLTAILEGVVRLCTAEFHGRAIVDLGSTAYPGSLCPLHFANSAVNLLVQVSVHLIRRNAESLGPVLRVEEGVVLADPLNQLVGLVPGVAGGVRYHIRLPVHSVKVMSGDPFEVLVRLGGPVLPGALGGVGLVGGSGLGLPGWGGSGLGRLFQCFYHSVGALVLLAGGRFFNLKITFTHNQT